MQRQHHRGDPSGEGWPEGGRGQPHCSGNLALAISLVLKTGYLGVILVQAGRENQRSHFLVGTIRTSVKLHSVLTKPSTVFLDSNMTIHCYLTILVSYHIVTTLMMKT
jgi:hypothetical protein